MNSADVLGLAGGHPYAQVLMVAALRRDNERGSVIGVAGYVIDVRSVHSRGYHSACLL